LHALTDASAATGFAQVAIRRKTLLNIDGGAAAARVLVYGTGPLDQTAEVEMTQAEKEACALNAQLFSEGLTQATSVGTCCMLPDTWT
jgi:hypothetical protein